MLFSPSDVKKWAVASLSKLDAENKKRAEKSLEIMTEEYVKHKLLDKGELKLSVRYYYSLIHYIKIYVFVRYI